MSFENNVLTKATRNALATMKSAGFEISNRLRVIVDPDLPFMGYSTKRNSDDVIVVAGRSLRSGMIEGLLIHEMSHVYRTNMNHPSHDRELLNRVGYSFIRKNQLTEDYQVAVVQEAVNHVQDLYADDIAFRAFGHSEGFSLEQIFNFFLDWISDTAAAGDDIKTAWQNMRIMLNNCFVLSNLTRHGVPDVNGQAESKVQKFLSQTGQRMKEAFVYFENFMVNLKEDVTKMEFEENMREYLTRIIEIAN